eukprot:72507-Hanusia_phi.AAC.1
MFTTIYELVSGPAGPQSHSVSHARAAGPGPKDHRRPPGPAGRDDCHTPVTSDTSFEGFKSESSSSLGLSEALQGPRLPAP